MPSHNLQYVMTIDKHNDKESDKGQTLPCYYTDKVIPSTSKRAVRPKTIVAIKGLSRMIEEVYLKAIMESLERIAFPDGTRITLVVISPEPSTKTYAIQFVSNATPEICETMLLGALDSLTGGDSIQAITIN